MRHLQVVRLFVCCLSLFVPAAGKAESTSLLNPQSSSPVPPSLERKIELLIRSEFSVPPEYEVSFGARSESDIEGYDKLPVTFIHEDKKTSVEFLVSKDGATLARLERFNINNNAAFDMDAGTHPVRGVPAAKVAIINFDDLECPACGMLNNEILPATLEHYKGLVKVLYRDYPLPGHPWARHAAIDANCLAAQSASAYWSYVDFVHSHGQDISGPRSDVAKSFVALDNIADSFATQSNVDQTQLAMCLKKQDDALVNQSLKLGSSLGVSATPQVFVDGERLPSGAQPAEKLWPAIDRALKAQGIQPPPSKTP